MGGPRSVGFDGDLALGSALGRRVGVEGEDDLPLNPVLDDVRGQLRDDDGELHGARASRPNSRAIRPAWLLTVTTSLRPRMGKAFPLNEPGSALRAPG